MTDKTKKRKHHYLPRFYLEGFCDQQGMIWTYHKNNPDKEAHCQKPENTAVKRDFYSINSDIPSNTDIFEDSLAEIIEDPAADPLKRLISGKTPSTEDRERLAPFFGFMLTRTPKYKAHYETSFNKEFNLSLRSNNDYLTGDNEKLRQDISNEVYQAKIHPNFSLYIMQNLAFSSAFLLAKMKWIIIMAPENFYFLTSDFPVLITNPNCHGYYSPSLGMQNTRIFIPISKTLDSL